jgi:hypothetical protein
MLWIAVGTTLLSRSHGRERLEEALVFARIGHCGPVHPTCAPANPAYPGGRSAQSGGERVAPATASSGRLTTRAHQSATTLPPAPRRRRLCLPNPAASRSCTPVPPRPPSRRQRLERHRVRVTGNNEGYSVRTDAVERAWPLPPHFRAGAAWRTVQFAFADPVPDSIEAPWTCASYAAPARSRSAAPSPATSRWLAVASTRDCGKSSPLSACRA